MRNVLVLLAVGAAAGVLAAPAAASETTIKAALFRGVADIRGTPGERELDAKLLRVLAELRSAHGSTPAERTARTLAIAGFTWTRRGLRARIDFVEKDSGNVAAATRDARAADRRLRRGAALLRRAGAALGIRIGALGGY